MGNELIPVLVDALFENENVEMVNVLCVLSCFSKRKKGISYSELVYYYTVAVSEFEFNEESNSIRTRYNVTNLFISIQSRLRSLLIGLFNLELVKLYGDIDVSLDSIKIKITDKGNILVQGLEAEYYVNAIYRTNYTCKNYSYTKTLEKKMLERRS